MNDILIYLLKVSLAISLVTIPYYWVLRNDSMLLVKRIYLLGGLILAWIFPLLVMSKPGLAPDITPAFLIDPFASASTTNEIALPYNNANHISTSTIIGFLYILGMLFLFLKNTATFIKIKSTIIKDRTANQDVVITSNDQVFTIFPKIFIPKKHLIDSELNSIMIHEKAHISQLHFLDLLLAEITLLFTWFNPFSWLISRMIKENHEHLADRSVLRQGVNPAHYKALLLNHAMGGEVFRLGHQLNHSLTKKRFKMMKKIKAPRKGILKYILFVPVILAFTLIATASTQNTKTIHGKVYLESKDVPATGASVVIYKTSSGTVVDKKGEFTLEADENDIITISFVGFETVQKKAKEISSKPITLIPTSIIYTLSDPNSKVVEKDVSNIIIRSKNDGNKEPTYVVDDKKVKSIDDLNPEDIERVAVIKDPENPIFKKYNAEHGVILITTKKKASKNDNVASSEEKQAFFVVEDMPQFPGDKEALGTYISENLKYPDDAKSNGLNGKVMVGFLVNTKGELENIHVTQSSNKIFDEAALAVFKDMPAWKPGKQRGKPVKVNIIVPVRFNPDTE